MSHEIKAGHCPVCHEKGTRIQSDVHYNPYHCVRCEAYFWDCYKKVFDGQRWEPLEVGDFTDSDKARVFSVDAPDYKALWLEAVEVLIKCRGHIEADTGFDKRSRLELWSNLCAAISKGASDE